MMEIETEAKVGSAKEKHNCYFTESIMKYLTKFFWEGMKCQIKERSR